MQQEIGVNPAAVRIEHNAAPIQPGPRGRRVGSPQPGRVRMHEETMRRVQRGELWRR